VLIVYLQERRGLEARTRHVQAEEGFERPYMMPKPLKTLKSLSTFSPGTV